MSKVICEICGTAYPDTENECPVCGFEKTETAEILEEEGTAAANPGHVKGGRFSKSNVNKKNSDSNRKAEAPAKRKRKKKRGNSDRGLIIAIIVLLLAIIATAGYIYIKYFAPEWAAGEDTKPVETTTKPTIQTLPPQTQGSTETADLSCTGLTLYEESVRLNEIGGRWLLNVVPTPANTTDVITYSSGDGSVVTVSETGEIIAVGNGETVITITCGEITVECKVVCQVLDVTEPQETDPEETEPQETDPEETKPQQTGDFKFNTKYGDEVSMRVGDSWTAYVGDIDVEDIEWSVGNTSVATVKNGRVKAVGAGTTTLRAVYNGVEYTCLIRCSN